MGTISPQRGHGSGTLPRGPVRPGQSRPTAGRQGRAGGCKGSGGIGRPLWRRGGLPASRRPPPHFPRPPLDNFPPPRKLQGSQAGAGSVAPAHLDLPGGARTSAPSSGTPSGLRLRTSSAKAAPPPSCPVSELPRPPPRRPS